jgi:hypothetical protein
MNLESSAKIVHKLLNEQRELRERIANDVAETVRTHQELDALARAEEQADGIIADLKLRLCLSRVALDDVERHRASTAEQLTDLRRITRQQQAARLRSSIVRGKLTAAARQKELQSEAAEATHLKSSAADSHVASHITDTVKLMDREVSTMRRQSALASDILQAAMTA